MGGMERVLTLLANYAEEERYSVSIICIIEKKIEYPLNNNISIYAPEKKYKKGFINKLRVFLFLYGTLRAIKPDSALCFSEVFNPLALVVGRAAGIPVFISDRSNPYKVLRRSIRFLRKITYPLAKGMISQTELAKEVAIKRKYNKNISVIPNPLRQINDEYKKEYGNKVISIGRLVATKKIDELIEIFSSIDNAKGWELLIVGEGNEKEKLLSKIRELEIEDRVRLIGAVKDVDKYLAKASIFAFTSVSEGFPNALSEAVAFPLASIAYDCPAGPADILRDNKNGFLIELNDSETFKKRLEELIMSSELRNRLIQNYTHYREELGIKRICSEFLNFIFS